MAYKLSQKGSEINAILGNTSGANTGDEDLTRLSSIAAAAAAKATPIDADSILIVDSASGSVIKRFLISALNSMAQTLTNKKINGQKFKKNQSTAAQVITAQTRTYIAGSQLTFDAGELSVGTRFHWVFNVQKTAAAGAAASTIDIAIGTAGSTLDTARLSFAKPAGTTVTDTGRVEIDAVVRAVGASCVITGHMHSTHNLSTTGFQNVPCAEVPVTSSSFNVSTATSIGLCITSGASDSYTIQLVEAEAWNL